MKRPARRTLKIDFVVQSELWKKPRGVRTPVRRAVAAAADVLSTSAAELAIVLTDDSTIRGLNRQWRGIDAATNVLSFATTRAGGTPPLLGDIVLAFETIASEARAARKPFANHLAHLAVHGFLHLNGYDHEREEDAVVMEQIERKILRRLSLSRA